MPEERAEGRDVAFLLPLAAALFPSAAPIIGAIGGLVSALGPHGAPPAPVPPPVDSGGVPFPGRDLGYFPADVPTDPIAGTYGPDLPSGYRTPDVPYDETPPALPPVTTVTGELASYYPGPGPASEFAAAAAGAAGGGVALATTGGGMLARLGGRALARIEQVVPRALLVAGGAALAEAIYRTYVGHRRAGHNHRRARRLALQAHGIVLRRRRMRPTNVHALRRAIRRVRGFQRVARKVRGLGLGGRRAAMHRAYYRPRRHRRGDLDAFMVEDYQDQLDEAYDEGGEDLEEDFAVGE